MSFLLNLLSFLLPAISFEILGKRGYLEGKRYQRIILSISFGFFISGFLAYYTDLTWYASGQPMDGNEAFSNYMIAALSGLFIFVGSVIWNFFQQKSRRVRQP